DPVAAPQPLHSATRHLLAGTAQRLPDPPVAVGVVVDRMQLPDPCEQPLILEGSLGSAAAAALVVRGHRHAQGLADRLDPEAARVAAVEVAEVEVAAARVREQQRAV